MSKSAKNLNKIRGRSTWQLNQKWDGIHLQWNELVVAKGFLNAGNNSFTGTVFSECLWKSLLELDKSFGRCQLQGSKSLAYKNSAWNGKSRAAFLADAPSSITENFHTIGDGVLTQLS